MSRLQLSHPDEEQLLRYADGESPARDAAKIRSHLEACWQCRAALEEVQVTIGECVRYRKNVLQELLPPPPEPWPDIRRRFDEIDAEHDSAGFWDRARRFLRPPIGNAYRWAPVALAGVVICILLFYRFHQTPSVQAAELLRNAVAAASAHPDKPHRIQIRTKDRRLTRVAGDAPRLAVSDADSDRLRSLQAMFRAADYDWDDPLSAKSYQSWRDHLAEKHDEVVEERDRYQVRTTGPGELSAASLNIRMRDLRPVEGRFEFRNGEWVEITELTEVSTPAPAEIAAAVNSKPLPILVPDPARLPDTVGAATIGDELQVLAALNQVGADLGDPIEVSRQGADILVSGAGIAPQRQQEIRDALVSGKASRKHVVIRFSKPAPAATQPENSSADLQPQQARMAEQVGGRTNFEELGAQVLDLTEPMMSRAYALRRLADHIPSQLEPELSVQDWRILRSLRREHTAELRRKVAEIDRLLQPLLGLENGTARSEPEGVTSSGSWQPATEELFQAARRVDKLVAVVFGAAPGESSREQLSSQLHSGLAQLRARLEAYDRLSADPVERRVERKD